MPRGVTRAVLSRTEEVHRLLQSEGCVTVEKARKALGLSRMQVKYVLQRLQSKGQAVPVAVGRTTLWCRDGETAAQALEELTAEARRLLCGLRFVTPGKLLRLIGRDKKASKTFSKYVPLSPTVAATMSFLNALLQTIFGQPVMYMGNGATPVYLVPPSCGQNVKF
jgi:predicted ArsR family transcriptional regulator